MHFSHKIKPMKIL